MSETGPPSRDQLPLPDYDHLPVGSLQGRIRSLDADQLGQLLAYEEAHGHRLPVVQVLRTRLEAVRDGAPLSGGSPTAERPEQAQAPEPPSQASPETSGPPLNPPSQGDPTNPAQPRG
ncbi:MAG TPA: hypothetical protein VD814_08815 [Nocardioides sp.]|nr:hypothetical protein [Nocardioides sp.]